MSQNLVFAVGQDQQEDFTVGKVFFDFCYFNTYDINK